MWKRKVLKEPVLLHLIIWIKVRQVWHKSKLIIRLMLQTQVLRVGQVNKPCIGLTQENSIENFVQNCLSFILNYNGPCYYFPSLL